MKRFAVVGVLVAGAAVWAAPAHAGPTAATAATYLPGCTSAVAAHGLTVGTRYDLSVSAGTISPASATAVDAPSQGSGGSISYSITEPVSSPQPTVQVTITRHSDSATVATLALGPAEPQVEVEPAGTPSIEPWHVVVVLTDWPGGDTVSLGPHDTQTAAVSGLPTSVTIGCQSTPVIGQPENTLVRLGYRAATSATTYAVDVTDSDGRATTGSTDHPPITTAGSRAGTTLRGTEKASTGGSTLAAGWDRPALQTPTLGYDVVDQGPALAIYRFVEQDGYDVQGGQPTLLPLSGPVDYNDPVTLFVGTDGAFTAQRPDGQTVFTSGTAGSGPGAFVTMQTDGNLVLRDAKGTALWASRGGVLRTSLATDQYLVAPEELVSGGTATLGTNGELVVRGPHRTWTSGKAWASRGKLVLQPDGNLVVRDGADKAVWASGTAGSGATTLVMQPDGNLVLRTATGKAVWSTGTN